MEVLENGLQDSGTDIVELDEVFVGLHGVGKVGTLSRDCLAGDELVLVVGRYGYVLIHLNYYINDLQF